MTTITMPTNYEATAMMWKLEQPSQQNVSPWTGSRQIVASGRGWWTCEFQLPPIVGTANFNPWRSFIAAMRGSVNDTNVYVDPTQQYASANTVRVNGANQYGRSLVTDGWPVSTTVLVAGQFVTIDAQLLQLTADVVSDGSGNATISFEPNIRNTPADNTVVYYKNPYCRMYLEEDPSYSVGAGYVYNLSLKFREAF